MTDEGMSCAEINNLLASPVLTAPAEARRKLTTLRSELSAATDYLPGYDRGKYESASSDKPEEVWHLQHSRLVELTPLKLSPFFYREITATERTRHDTKQKGIGWEIGQSKVLVQKGGKKA